MRMLEPMEIAAFNHIDGRSHRVFNITQVIIRENHTIGYIKGFSTGYDAVDGARPPN